MFVTIFFNDTACGNCNRKGAYSFMELGEIRALIILCAERTSSLIRAFTEHMSGQSDQRRISFILKSVFSWFFAGASTSRRGRGLSEAIVAALPPDPYDQLEMARKITSVAVAARLRQKLADKDSLAVEHADRADALDKALRDADARLCVVLKDNAKLVKERDSLVHTSRKLARDLAKVTNDDPLIHWLSAITWLLSSRLLLTFL